MVTKNDLVDYFSDLEDDNLEIEILENTSDINPKFAHSSVIKLDSFIKRKPFDFSVSISCWNHNKHPIVDEMLLIFTNREKEISSSSSKLLLSIIDKYKDCVYEIPFIKRLGKAFDLKLEEFRPTNMGNRIHITLFFNISKV